VRQGQAELFKDGDGKMYCSLACMTLAGEERVLTDSPR
jgi:hypothetical protein